MLLSGLHDTARWIDILARMRRSATHRLVPRRLVLGGLLLGGGAVVAGCSGDGPDVDFSRLDPRSDPPTPTTTAELREPADADADADVLTLEAAYAEVLATATLLEAVAQRHQRLAPALQPLVRLHRAHAEVLAGAAPEDPPTRPPSGRSPRTAAKALALVRSTEESTQNRLGGWALDARSGTFARLLGSMAAAIGQQYSTLPTKVSARPGANG